MAWLLKVLATRLGRKLIAVAAVVVVAVGLMALWLHLVEAWRVEQRRLERAGVLRVERARLAGELERARAALGEVEAEFSRQQQRLETARRLARTVEEMWDWWERLWMPAEEKRRMEERERLAREEAALAEGALGKLKELVGRGAQDVLELDAAHAAAEAELAGLEAAKAPAVRVVEEAWVRVKWPLAVAVAGILFGPSLWKAFLYYAFARWFERARPLQIAAPGGPSAVAGGSGVSLAVPVGPGQRVWLREPYLQASDEHLERRAKILFDWRMPFTSLAARLHSLVEFAVPPGASPGQVTVSSQDEEHTEFAIVTVPEGGALVLRPRFLAGVVLPAGGRLRVRRHWFLGRRHAWLTGQVRHLEFVGPVRLVVFGTRGVRTEVLEAEPGATPPARRVNADATIAYSPSLAYGCVRAETFWSFYWDHNPLFDDVFRGRGLFLCQEISAPGPAAAARGFWSGVWGAVLKVFGL